jgi:putative transposase
MPSPYSNDLRIRVIKAIELGKQSKPEIAQHFSVSLYFIYSLWSHYQATGSVKPKQIGGYVKPKVNKVGEEHIKEWLENNPDLTLEQLCDRYEEHFSVKMGTSSMDRALKRAKITVKKKAHTIHKKKVLVFKN